MGNLMPKPFFYMNKKRYYLTHNEVIHQKVLVTDQMEHELSNYDVAVQHFSHYAIETLPILFLDTLTKRLMLKGNIY